VLYKRLSLTFQLKLRSMWKGNGRMRASPMCVMLMQKAENSNACRKIPNANNNLLHHNSCA
jgi:hypothetical protein